MPSPPFDDPYGPDDDPTAVTDSRPTPVENLTLTAVGEKRFLDGVRLMAVGLRFGLIRCGVPPDEVPRIVSNVRAWGEKLTSDASPARMSPTPGRRGAGRPP